MILYKMLTVLNIFGLDIPIFGTLKLLFLQVLTSLYLINKPFDWQTFSIFAARYI